MSMLRIIKILLGAVLFTFSFLFLVGIISGGLRTASAAVSPSPTKTVSPLPEHSPFKSSH